MEPSPRATQINALQGHYLGQYQIAELLGRGGMAIVYKALQPSLHRYVAIKVLPPYLVQEEEFRFRFRREAETVARLEHPNILPIYDFGQDGDIAYIVMPLVTGGTFGDWLKQSPPLDRALPVLSRILSALHYAHTREPAIVHRDIKPANILMREGDWPLLTDFGIAKILEPSQFATGAGTIIGTPEYMAPEQTQGHAVDARTDLYAIGIMLFQILTGRLPFEGPTPVMVLMQQVQDEVRPPRTLNPTLSPVWDEVIRRSLAKNPTDRYPTAVAMDQAIQAAWRQAQREPAPASDAAVTRVEVLKHASQLVHEGDRALAAELFTEARQHYQEALQFNPNLADALTGLDRVQRAQQLAGLYHAARADIAGERWDDAAVKLDAIFGLDPRYYDVDILRQMVARQQHRQGPPAPRSTVPAPPTRQEHAPPITPAQVTTAGPGSPPAATPWAAQPIDRGAAPPTRIGAARRHEAPTAQMTAAGDQRGRASDSPALSAPPASTDEGHTSTLVRVAGLLAVVAVLALALAGIRAITGGSDAGPKSASGAAVTATPGGPTATPSAVPATPAPSAADLLAECESIVAAQRWSEALAACEGVRDRDAALPGLSVALAKTYVGLGKDELARGGPLAPALGYFEQALAVSPDDPDALQQRAWGNAYQDGDAALAANNWAAAAENFGAVYAEAPDYLEKSGDGGVKSKLLATRLGWGQALLQAGEYREALRRCEQALELAPDSGDAAGCRTAALVALATPTPRPQPTNPPQAAPPPSQAAPPPVRPAQPAPTPVPARPAPPPQAAPPPPTQPALAPPPTRPVFAPSY